MSAVGYVRVSTIGQAEAGLSLEAQEAQIRRWCEREDTELVSLHTDRGLSGRTDARPGLQSALESCKKGDVLVVYSLSRLARSTRDTLNILAMLEKRKVDLVSLSEKIDGSTAAGRLMVKMLAMLAEFESEQLGERTALAMRHLKAKGLFTGGGVPYGFRVGEEGRLVRCNAEMEIRDMAMGLYTPRTSLKEVCQHLEAMGFRSRTGKPFVPMQICRMLRQTT